MRLLLVNANTTQRVTDLVVAEARLHAAPGTEIVGATAGFGVAIVSTDAENVVAGHAALDLLAGHAGQVDAAVLAISMDTALSAAQGLLGVPVLGMTAAALHTACLVGRRFGVVTFGAVTRGLYLDLVRESGLSARMVGCETIALANAASYLDHAVLDAAALEAVARLEQAGAASVVLVGAATTGMARRLQAQMAVPLLDGIACGVRLAEAMVGLGLRPARAAPLPKEAPPAGLSAALAAALGGSG